jgi:hypothetical protein
MFWGENLGVLGDSTFYGVANMISRRAHHRVVVELMIRRHCWRRHGHRLDLCPQCRDLLEYAASRLDACVHGDAKPPCLRCPVHCFRPEMRAAIRQIMRENRLWFLCRHPLHSLRYLLWPE